MKIPQRASSSGLSASDAATAGAYFSLAVRVLGLAPSEAWRMSPREIFVLANQCGRAAVKRPTRTDFEPLFQSDQAEARLVPSYKEGDSSD